MGVGLPPATMPFRWRPDTQTCKTNPILGSPRSRFFTLARTRFLAFQRALAASLCVRALGLRA